MPDTARHVTDAPVADDIHCVWGLLGLQAALPHADGIVVVDVLSFCTTVDVAVSRGVVVHPWRWRDESGQQHADAVGAVLAGPRGSAGTSLSPCSFLETEPGTRVVLPSPNGATLSRATGEVPTWAACLRNATASARAAQTAGRRIAVVAAGELWPDPAHSLRPALEDWLGAGAVIDALGGSRSPEALAAAEAWQAARASIGERLLACTSGRELVERGFARDVELAAEHDVSSVAPRLVDGAYVG